jgi:gentisate 1,2-dioxygenase
MEPGDFILTPHWTFHDHGNQSDSAVIWLDGLDVPIVNMFETAFGEDHPLDMQPISRKEGDALARYGANMLPLNYKRTALHSPIFNYPYSRSREALDRLYKNGPIDPTDGIKLQYANPITGGYPMPTIAAFLQFLPKGFQGVPYRSTEGTVYSAAEGQGETRIGDTTFTWGPRDIFVVPSWYPVSHRATSDAVLFSFSDRAAQQALGIWREERVKS